jgi:exopolysaccharide production protein ExoY
MSRPTSLSLAPRTDGSVSRDVQLRCKRAFDMAAAAVLLFVMLPLLAGIALLVRFSDGGSVFFRQTRVGLGGRQFTCLKFRSMVPDAETALEEHLARNPKAREEWARSQKLADDPRITRIGAFLRKTSLDELPQLYNVLVGDMSLVGPRPILQVETARYHEHLQSYLSVRPGLTGLWQISGRSDCSYSERVALDVRYVREWRLLLDLLILARTIPAVWNQRGSC